MIYEVDAPLLTIPSHKYSVGSRNTGRDSWSYYVRVNKV